MPTDETPESKGMRSSQHALMRTGLAGERERLRCLLATGPVNHSSRSVGPAFNLSETFRLAVPESILGRPSPLQCSIDKPGGIFLLLLLLLLHPRV
ncbi:hypothetical protein ElyMa_000757300 [Elysia marginata]|uniref:Uncharacterized protein n=1 Tax=Elysia marginata TaxID=1093978 RepID=A0AAV4GU82_9GAST|nr:hypothetical protein ElyMa_000757300 [Elysia marginata]